MVLFNFEEKHLKTLKRKTGKLFYYFLLLLPYLAFLPPVVPPQHLSTSPRAPSPVETSENAKLWILLHQVRSMEQTFATRVRQVQPPLAVYFFIFFQKKKIGSLSCCAGDNNGALCRAAAAEI